MKRARFLADMDLDDDADDFLTRRPAAPTYHPHRHRPRPPPPPPQERRPGFFGLPPELKAHIYSLVLLDRDRVAPPAAPYLGDHQAGHGEIRYPQRYRAWRWPTTHWVSRAMRNDMVDHVTDALLQRRIRPELDIMVHGFLFFPTWLYLPPDLGGDIAFDLDLSLRLFSPEAFRPNDGWPRQPGAGFRMLLRLLNQLYHEGPSFGQHFEILAGRVKWPINTLSVRLSFHDPYTPATHPDTAHEIFRMLKALATSGLAHGILQTIRVHAEYTTPDGPVARTATWPVARAVDEARAKQWRQTGFLTVHQRTLADDYRPDEDFVAAVASPAAASRAPRLVSPLERRDSPIGVVVAAPEGKNPQLDDYGLITPPTPRASVEGLVGSAKRRSTPVPPASAGSGNGNGNVGTMLDDYSAVMTPGGGGGGVVGLLDDYSLVMTPVMSGPVEDGDDY